MTDQHKVDAFIAKNADWREELEFTCQILLETLLEAIKNAAERKVGKN